MYNDILANISTAVVLSMLIPLFLFVYFYSKSRWEASEEGRTMMAQKVAWIVLIIFLFVSKFFGDFPGRVEIGIAIYTGIAFLFWRFFLNLRRVQKNPTPTAPTMILKEKDND